MNEELVRDVATTTRRFKGGRFSLSLLTVTQYETYVPVNVHVVTALRTHNRSALDRFNFVHDLYSHYRFLITSRSDR
ncbi:hypothetical protein D3C84_946990 [compost metagenome]